MKKILLTTTAILLAMTLSTGTWAATVLDPTEDKYYNGEAYYYKSDSYEYQMSSYGRFLYEALYDSNENLTKKFYYNWENREKALDTGIAGCEIFKECQSTADLYTKETNATWKVACVSESYDTMGFCSLFDSPENGTKLCDGLCAALYDSNGNVTQLTYYDTQTGKTKLSEESFDSNGKLTQRITYDSDGTTILGTETFAYDSDGNLIKDESAALKIYTAEQAYAATSKGNHNSISIRFK